MATTRIMSMHINKGKTISQCLKERVEYIKNPDKTEGGELISSYACSPETADHEFLLARNAYLANTGRQIHNEVIAYQLRQSFKPGEVTPEEANQIGYELASELLKGDYAFIVATHTDRKHIHNHIAFCSVSLECTHKFRDVIRSGKLVAELSDKICEEHRLSVIKNPQDKTVSYDKWLGNNAKTSGRDWLRMTIDAALRMQPDGFDALMQLLEDAGCWIKRGAQISIKPPNGKRYVRLDTLGAEDTEAALRSALTGHRVHIPKVPRSQFTPSQVELLIDIEAKLRAGKGKGYQRWAERHNTDAVAKSMIYLKEHHISSYDELEEKLRSALASRNALKDRIRTAQSQMTEIRNQRNAILSYRKTKDIYTQYRESGWSPAFYREHKAEIEAHKKAQAIYSAADGKLPTLAELSEEFDRLLNQKREDSEVLSQHNTELRDLRHIKTNLDTLLSDEDYEADLHNHAIPSEPDQHRSCESVER